MGHGGNASYVALPCKMATHPCPCGHFGDLCRESRCAPSQVQKYRNRLSGPLMDRIDIHVEVPAMELKDLDVLSGFLPEGRRALLSALAQHVHGTVVVSLHVLHPD